MLRTHLRSKGALFCLLFQLITSGRTAHLFHSSAALHSSSEHLTAINNAYRTKRDETENIRGAYGRGIAFYVGEPCEDQCNRILFHVFCNLTSHECACLPDYPVNVDNTICAQGEVCEYDASCKYFDKNSVCDQEEKKCRCDHHHYPKVDTILGPVCTKAAFSFAANGIYAINNNYELLTAISAISSLLLFLILLFFIYRHYNKPSRLDCSLDQIPCRFTGNGPPTAATTDDRISPFLLLADPLDPPLSCSPLSSTRRVSPGSISQLAPPPPPFRSASFSMLAPPAGSNFLSRRPSLSSLQSSFRSCSSLRSQTSNRPFRPLSARNDYKLQHETNACESPDAQKRRMRLLRDAHFQSSEGKSNGVKTSSGHYTQMCVKPFTTHYDAAYQRSCCLSRSANSVLQQPRYYDHHVHPTRRQQSINEYEHSGTSHFNSSQHKSSNRIQTLRAPSSELLNQYLGNYFPQDVNQDQCAVHQTNLPH